MTFTANKLNNNGQEILEIHRQYHDSNCSGLQKKAFFSLATQYLGNKQSTWSEAFLNPDPSVINDFLLGKKQFQMDDQSLLPQISEYITSILNQAGVHAFEIGLMNPHNTRYHQFFLEHRIGLKASSMAQTVGGKAEDIHAFFHEGHAKAIVKQLLFPAISAILFPLAKRNQLDICYDFESSRKYTYNLKIKFILKYPKDITEKTILNIGECLKAIDDFRQKNTILF